MRENIPSRTEKATKRRVSSVCCILNAFHVIRRSDRFWAGFSSDLVIESVLMKSLKAIIGLTRGRGMSELQRLVRLHSEVDFTTSEQHKDMSDTGIKGRARYQDNSRIYGSQRSI